jgi:hypothetical protein
VIATWGRIVVEEILSVIAIWVRIAAPLTIAIWVRIVAAAVIRSETGKFQAGTVREARELSAALAAAVEAKLAPVARAVLPVLVVLEAAVPAVVVGEGEQFWNSAENADLGETNEIKNTEDCCVEIVFHSPDDCALLRSGTPLTRLAAIETDAGAASAEGIYHTGGSCPGANSGNGKL